MNVSATVAEKVRNELSRLDEMEVMVDGKPVKPSTCYYFGSSPLHVLYNLNCPDKLKEIIQDIIQKHVVTDENGSHQ